MQDINCLKCGKQWKIIISKTRYQEYLCPHCHAPLPIPATSTPPAIQPQAVAVTKAEPILPIRQASMDAIPTSHRQSTYKAQSIRHSPVNSRKRVWMYATFGSILLCIIIALVYWKYLNVTWEPRHHDQIALALDHLEKSIADKQYDAAKTHYNSVNQLIGNHRLADDTLVNRIRNDADLLQRLKNRLELERQATAAREQQEKEVQRRADEDKLRLEQESATRDKYLSQFDKFGSILKSLSNRIAAGVTFADYSRFCLKTLIFADNHA